MKRRTARENAVLALYEASFQANSIEEIIAAARENPDCEQYAVDAYGEALLMNFYAHSSEVDELIVTKLKDWTLARLPRVNAAILRIAITEMLYHAEPENMDSVVINEAVEICKKYAGDEDYQFVNGVLGAVARQRAQQEPAQAQSTGWE